tara:strand:- start:54 stop:389 length:336 start_codon:yes stop_codon:yes gene_type:complete
MKKKITVKADSTYKYLQLWNGIFNLTNTELIILSTFIDVDNIIEDTNFCSMQNKKAVAASSGIKDPNTLNNYIKKFKDKGVIQKVGSNYVLNRLLIPELNGETIEITILKK